MAATTMHSLLTVSNPQYASAEVMYAANVAQLFLGVLITGANSLLLASIIARPRGDKTSTSMLLGNISLVNLVVGIMLSLVNVADGWYEVSLLKTESALVVLDCFVNVASLLALITNNFVAIKNPSNHMSVSNCGKIIFGIWATVLFLCFCKALVFAFDKLHFPTACYRCFVVFEIVTLLIFSLVTLLVFVTAIYMVVKKIKGSVSDHAQPSPETRNREFTMLKTAGIMLLNFLVCFLLFLFTYISWLAERSSVSPGLAEIIVSLFFFHALINPLIIIIRHKDIRDTVKSILFCGYFSDDTGDNAEEQPGPDADQNNGSAMQGNLRTYYNRTATPHPNPPPRILTPSQSFQEPYQSEYYNSSNPTPTAPKSPARLPPVDLERTPWSIENAPTHSNALSADQEHEAKPAAENSDWTKTNAMLTASNPANFTANPISSV